LPPLTVRMYPPALDDVFHLDDLAGAVAWGLHRFTHASPNTLGEVDIYRRLSSDALFPAPTEIPRARVSPRWSLPGVVSEDVIFPSLHAPLEPTFCERYLAEYRETQTVYARRIRPTTGRSSPRILYLHGYLQPETHVEELVLAGIALHLGMEITQLEPPYHGRRTPRGAHFSGEFYCTADLVRTIEALRQNVLDARTLLGWLLAQDARPVGILGLSLGGLITLILACVEEKLAFTIPLIAHMNLCALIQDASILAPMRRELQELGWGSEDTRKLVSQMGWSELRPKLPPHRIHLFAAADDHLFTAAAVNDLWCRWGRPAIRWYPSSHLGFLAHLPDVVRGIAEFVDRLDLRTEHVRAHQIVA
jgi:pimeloyl-ACP methyl ester carboxylesterase